MEVGSDKLRRLDCFDENWRGYDDKNNKNLIIWRRLWIGTEIDAYFFFWSAEIENHNTQVNPSILDKQKNNLLFYENQRHMCLFFKTWY